MTRHKIWIYKEWILSAMIIAVLAVVLLNVLMKSWHHNFYRDREFEYYMNQLTTQGFIHGDQVIEALGKPDKIEYIKNETSPSSGIDYIKIHYNGYTFGILGNSLEERIVMIHVTKPGIISLRNNIDIGSLKSKADAAYRYEKKIIGSYGFILGEEHETADGGGTWIYLDTDRQPESVSEITITDGL